jgi:hypothetical protein
VLNLVNIINIYFIYLFKYICVWVKNILEAGKF